jgi:hypothetical protein
MSLFDFLHRNHKQHDLTRLAGGAHRPGDRLEAGVPYMSDRTGEDVTRWVAVWRHMPDEQYKALARSL